MKVDIEVKEILSRVVTVDETISTIQEMYNKEKIVLDYSDFDGYVIIENKQ